MLLYKQQVELSFGEHRFRLILDEEASCIRVEVLVPTALVILETLSQLVSEMLLEYMPGLDYVFGVPVDGGARSEGYKHYGGSLLRLDGCEGLKAKVENNEDLTVDGSKRLSADVLRQLFHGVLPQSGLQDNYEVFISYRQGGFDAELASAIHQKLSREIVNGSPVRVFWDRICLQPGRDFSEDFLASLTRTQVAMPIVSSAALKRMFDLDWNSPRDNLFMEWLCILQLLESQQLKACVPVMLGPKIDHPDSLKIVRSLFSDKAIDKLPDIIVQSVVEDARRMLQSHGVVLTDRIAQMGVQQVVKSILNHQGVKGWDVGSPHGFSASPKEAEMAGKQSIIMSCVKTVKHCIYNNPVPTGSSLQHSNSTIAESQSPLTPDQSAAAGAQEVNEAMEKSKLEGEQEWIRAEREKISGEWVKIAEEWSKIQQEWAKLESARKQLHPPSLEAGTTDQNPGPASASIPEGSKPNQPPDRTASTSSGVCSIT
mmetsp:Transcript_23665/g.36975  ORF Transcript_23665/g.36975 Transcript_23665/m.36975 type:complete len:485 (+) Transcript_23665:1-1455(+)